MAIVNHETKEVQFKIVYCGTPVGGKTTNLQCIHAQLEAERRGDLVSLSTAADRTLYFDFLPINAVMIQDFKTRFQLYTVPGQVVYNATRQLVLRGVDGLVFVADSQNDRMEENIECFNTMKENLEQNRTSLEEIPLVLQYNKRDLEDVAPINYMDFTLNNGPDKFETFEAVATEGENVFNTLNAISQLVLQRFHRIVEESEEFGGEIVDEPNMAKAS